MMRSREKAVGGVFVVHALWSVVRGMGYRRRTEAALLTAVGVFLYLQLVTLPGQGTRQQGTRQPLPGDQLGDSTARGAGDQQPTRDDGTVSTGTGSVVRAIHGDSKVKPPANEILDLTLKHDLYSNSTAEPLLLLFSSWAYSEEKSSVHAATLRLWSSWPYIRPAVLTDDPRVQEMAGAAGWTVSGQLQTRPDCHGPPVLAPMFRQLMQQQRAHFYGFSNSDIVYGGGLADTLRFLARSAAWRDRPLLVIGRRHNVNFVNHSGLAVDTPQDVVRLTALGSLVNRSTDFFITNQLFPWDKVPQVSVGRPFVVRAIIGYALQKRIPVIDATKTIEAVHLTTQDGNTASFHKKGVHCNRALLVKRQWRLPLNSGHCECAVLETVRDAQGAIQIRQRAASKTFCH